MAGSEAAWQLARRGFRVRLSEMRGSGETTAAHQGDGLAELVCSNSFRSDDDEKNAVGLLHHEMRRCDSLIMAAADKARVPAGSALAVDRDVFSAAVEAALAQLPNLEVVRERVDTLPSEGMAIVATGPLTAPALAGSIGRPPAPMPGLLRCHRADRLPRLHRHGHLLDGQPLGQGLGPGKHRQGLHQLPDGQGPVPCLPQGLLDGEKTEFKEWEANTPISTAACPSRSWPSAASNLALRPDEAGRPGQSAHRALALCRRPAAPGQQAGHAVEHGRLPDQAQACRAGAPVPHDPGLENAEFARLGGLHRNTFIHSPTLLDRQLRLKSAPHIRFAGQITGCEGYVESASVGMLAGLMAASELAGRDWTPRPSPPRWAPCSATSPAMPRPRPISR
jgi:methylenetetrahydrofolate--tRNA-(uracil-5-)-methyltransferase